MSWINGYSYSSGSIPEEKLENFDFMIRDMSGQTPYTQGHPYQMRGNVQTFTLELNTLSSTTDNLKLNIKRNWKCILL